MTGVAILIALSQVPYVLGLAPGALRQPALEWLAAAQPLTAWVGVATAVIIWVVAWRWKRAPAALVGLAAGTAVYYATRFVVPGGALGPVVGTIAAGLPLPTAFAGIADLAVQPAAVRHLPLLATTAAVIAIIGSLDSLLAAAAIDAAAGTRNRANRELIAQGVGNIVSAAFGGVPVALSPTRAIPAWRAGGRTRAIGYIAAGLLAAVLLVGTAALAYLPLAVLGGVMLTVAWGLVDTWTRGIVRRLTAGERDRMVMWSAAVVVLVAAITVLGNFVIAVVVGVFLSMALFIATMNRSLVRAVYDGTARSSRRIYGPEDARRLAAERGRIKLVELEGAIFFGSAERLVIEAERWADTADHIVLDLRRVTMIDATGALGLEQLAKRLRGRKVNLALAGVTPDGRHGLALVAYGAFVDPSTREWFADADQAMEWAERRLLGLIDSFSPQAIRSSGSGRCWTRRRGDRGAPALAAAEGSSTRARRCSARASRASISTCSRAARYRSPSATPASTAASSRSRPARSSGRRRCSTAGTCVATAIVTQDAVVYSLSRSALDQLASTSYPALANKLLLNLGLAFLGLAPPDHRCAAGAERRAG